MAQCQQKVQTTDIYDNKCNRNITCSCLLTLCKNVGKTIYILTLNDFVCCHFVMLNASNVIFFTVQFSYSHSEDKMIHLIAKNVINLIKHSCASNATT